MSGAEPAARGPSPVARIKGVWVTKGESWRMRTDRGAKTAWTEWFRGGGVRRGSACRLQRRFFSSVLVCAGVALVVSAGGAWAQESYELEGDQVSIYNLAGRVQVVSGDGDRTVVEVLRGGGDAGSLSVETGRIGSRQTLRVRYPDRRVVYRESGGSSATVHVRQDGTFYHGWRQGEEVRVSGRGSGLEAHADIIVRLPAGTSVALFQAVGRVQAGDVRGDLQVKTGSASVTVGGVAGDVDVDTGAGSVTIVGVDGDVSADTGSGSVSLTTISGSSVTVDTGSGHIEGEDLAVGELSVDTGSGAIRVSGLRAEEVRCDTGSGSVRLELLSDVDHLEIDTGSGSVVVEVPPDFGAQVELDTGSGRIDVDVPGQVATTVRRDYYRGRVGDGRGRVTIDTGSGRVALRQS